MQAYSIEKTVSKGGAIQLEALPFSEGEPVQVIVLSRKMTVKGTKPSSLEGSVLKYIDPLEPVDPNEWIVLQ